MAELNSETLPTKKNKTPLFLAIGFLVLILVILGSILYLRTVFFVASPEDQLLLFSKQVLKPQFAPKALDLQKIIHKPQEYVEYSTTRAFDGNIFEFLAETDLDDKELGQYISGDVEGSGVDSDEVIQTLNNFFILPDNSSQILQRKEYPNRNLVGYEIILDHNKNYLDSIIAYVIPNTTDNGTIWIRIGACHIKAEAPEYLNNSCLAK